MEIEGLGMSRMNEEGVVTSSLDEIGGRHINDVDSMGEYNQVLVYRSMANARYPYLLCLMINL